MGGNVASSTEVTSIQNNTRVVRSVPSVFERPDSGSTAFRLEIFLYDSDGNMEAPDSAPTVSAVNQAGTSRNTNLDSTTMTLVATGHYRSTYTIADTHAIEQLLFEFSVVEGGDTRSYGNTAVVVDTTAVDFTAADRTKLDTLHDTRLTAARAGYLDNLNGHTPQTGDSFARLGAPAGASVSADIATVDTVVDGIQSDLSNGTDGLGALKTAIEAVFTSQMTESYASDGVAPTPAQAIFLIQQVLTDFAISGTTKTVRQINGSTTAATLTLDDATTPSAITRAT